MNQQICNHTIPCNKYKTQQTVVLPLAEDPATPATLHHWASFKLRFSTNGTVHANTTVMTVHEATLAQNAVATGDYIMACLVILIHNDKSIDSFYCYDNQVCMTCTSSLRSVDAVHACTWHHISDMATGTFVSFALWFPSIIIIDMILLSVTTAMK